MASLAHAVLEATARARGRAIERAGERRRVERRCARHADALIGVDPEAKPRERIGRRGARHMRSRAAGTRGLDLDERVLDRVVDAPRDAQRGLPLAFELRVDRAALVAIAHRAQVRDPARGHEQRRDGEHVDPGSGRAHAEKHSV